MSPDIEHLLAAAADDSDQPHGTDIDALLLRARRSARKARFATASTAALTTGVIIAGVATWSANRDDSAAPAGTPTPGMTLTMDVKTGRIIDDETGKLVVPPPNVSPVPDAQAVQQCAAAPGSGQPNGAGGPFDDRWQVVVKAGSRDAFSAMFLSPDKSTVLTCTAGAVAHRTAAIRAAVRTVLPGSPHHLPQAEENGLRIATPGVRRVLVDLAGEQEPREALVGKDGFFTLDYTRIPGIVIIAKIRGYDANGKKIYQQLNQPRNQPGAVEKSAVLKTADPITPRTQVTKDPATGKSLAPAPPVSPLTDEQVTTRCRGVDDVYWKDNGGSPVDPVTKDWQVALKTGSGDKLTAVLISPDRKSFAWCHMLTPTAGGAYDYTRGVVQPNGKIAETFEFGMVPDGVAQLVVDLPKQGPTRALISNGFYIWGLTGGNSDLKQVRVRGFDADGKQVYTTTKQVDADFD
ncbi:hypothetical protein [Kribbella sp.]|uniref:hypothetical protein n=1 Tax=Kribbella sp. TaxID=1871183 RepID=UPI002D599D96|nr:hypothetical protein [Kribbella sp.]HZX01327.1 hypothetical protein [Kribbella sp.]